MHAFLKFLGFLMSETVDSLEEIVVDFIQKTLIETFDFVTIRDQSVNFRLEEWFLQA